MGPPHHRAAVKPGAGGSAGGRRNLRMALLLLLPAAALLLFVFYLPVGTALLEGFREGPDSSAYSLRRFLSLLTDPYILRLLRFTAWQAFLSAALSVVIGLPLGYLLANRSFPGKSLVASLVMVPFVMPSITVALGFLIMYGTNGWFNGVLESLFGFKVRVLNTLWAIVLAHAFYNGPLVARMTQGAWERLDPALEESARTLGAAPFAVWRDVTLPAIAPGVLSGTVLAFIYCFMSFPIVLSLGGARFSTLEVEIFTSMRVLLDFETAAALAAIQAAVSLVFAYVFLRLEGRAPALFASTRARRPRPLGGKAGDAWIWVLLAALLVFFGGPMASIVADSLHDPRGGVSLAAYERIVTAGHNFHLGAPPLRTIQNSLRFAAIAAVIALVAGTCFVYATVRFIGRRLPLLETLSLAPIAVSSVALAYGLSVAFRGPLSLVPQDLRIPLVHGVLAFPFVVRAFRPVLEGVDARLIEAARTLGAGRWRAFVDVELPMAVTGLLVAFALCFGLSVSETTATLMLARPEQVTMPVSVYRFLAARDFPSASAMAVLLMAVTGGVFLLGELLAALLRRQRGGRAVARNA
ncbi:MAG: iron ABC transporter permease [Bacillota bacterium]|nr:iron ABC transporter permease [Bacillota bacterium]REJ36372.1 MAG: iron ABC transporter permease [Bacillota bacterium]